MEVKAEHSKYRQEEKLWEQREGESIKYIDDVLIENRKREREKGRMKTELNNSVFIKKKILNPNKKCKIGEREESLF